VSEASTFQALYTHTSGCGSCRMSSGVACDVGRQLHDAWRKAADADVFEQKREHEKRERQNRAPRPQPTTKRALAGGRRNVQP
jgi:hypothetical protein